MQQGRVVALVQDALHALLDAMQLGVVVTVQTLDVEHFLLELGVALSNLLLALTDVVLQVLPVLYIGGTWILLSRLGCTWGIDICLSLSQSVATWLVLYSSRDRLDSFWKESWTS